MNKPAETYAHMCRIDHEQIGHNDSEHEECPLCRALNRVRDLEAAVRWWYGRAQSFDGEKEIISIYTDSWGHDHPIVCELLEGGDK